MIAVVVLSYAFGIKYLDRKIERYMDNNNLILTEKIDSARSEVNTLNIRLDSLYTIEQSDRERFDREIVTVRSRLDSMDIKLEEFDKDLYAFD